MVCCAQCFAQVPRKQSGVRNDARPWCRLSGFLVWKGFLSFVVGFSPHQFTSWATVPVAFLTHLLMPCVTPTSREPWSISWPPTISRQEKFWDHIPGLNLPVLAMTALERSKQMNFTDTTSQAFFSGSRVVSQSVTSIQFQFHTDLSDLIWFHEVPGAWHQREKFSPHPGVPAVRWEKPVQPSTWLPFGHHEWRFAS